MNELNGTMFIILGMLVFIAGVLAMGYFGFHSMDKLNEKVPEINDLTDVRVFLEECQNTPLDCDGVLLKKLNMRDLK